MLSISAFFCLTCLCSYLGNSLPFSEIILDMRSGILAFDGGQNNLMILDAAYDMLRAAEWNCSRFIYYENVRTFNHSFAMGDKVKLIRDGTIGTVVGNKAIDIGDGELSNRWKILPEGAQESSEPKIINAFATDLQIESFDFLFTNCAKKIKCSCNF